MSTDFIPTRGSRLNPEQSQNFQTVIFEAHKRKAKPEHRLSESITEASSNEFNIKKAKHEIVKFGMSGLGSMKKEEAKIQLAIKLGAKPPKNKYKNYKVLKQERAKAKKEENIETQFQKLGKTSEGRSTVKTVEKKRKKKINTGLLDIYGKVVKNKT